MKPQPNKQLVLDSLAALAKDAGRPPSRSEFLSRSGVSEHAIQKFFPSWTAALQAAGLKPYTANRRLDDGEILADWARAARKHGKVPSRSVYAHFGKFDHRTLERRFGRWSQLPEVFRKFARGKPEWADVLTLLPAAPKPSPKRVPDLGPTSAPHSVLSPAPPAPVLSKVVIPSAARDLLFARHSSLVQSDPRRQSPTKFRHPHLDGRPTYGQPMDFRGLRHEPVNEQGVLLLFGMVAKELGYIVESVQSGFPDCEAKRQIAPQRWQRVQLEFEFESRNYRDHGHPLDGCDVIVCWRHSWPGHPPHLEILELSSLLPLLPHQLQPRT